jgi:hypothetical protein
MKHSFIGLLAGLVLGVVAVLGVRLGAASPAQEPQATAEVFPILIEYSTKIPHWLTINLEDEVPAMLVRVPQGKRFVLTDMWLLSHELLPVGTSPADRMWLECVNGSERLVVFDSPLVELKLPLRWQTGVSFVSGQEAWVKYSFASESKRPRRLHITGYFEPLEPVALEARIAR